MCLHYLHDFTHLFWCFLFLAWAILDFFQWVYHWSNSLDVFGLQIFLFEFLQRWPHCHIHFYWLLLNLLFRFTLIFDNLFLRKRFKYAKITFIGTQFIPKLLLQLYQLQCILCYFICYFWPRVNRWQSLEPLNRYPLVKMFHAFYWCHQNFILL